LKLIRFRQITKNGQGYKNCFILEEGLCIKNSAESNSF